MPTWAIWVPVISAGVGGFIAIIGSVFNNFINRRTEERKHLRESVLKIAIENWRDHVEIRNKEGGGTLPIESYIMHMAILSDVLLDPKKLNEKALIERLKKSDLLWKAHLKFDQERRG